MFVAALKWGIDLFLREYLHRILFKGKFDGGGEQLCFPSGEDLPRVHGLPSVKELCDAEEAMPQNAPLRSQKMVFLPHEEKVFYLLRCSVVSLDSWLTKAPKCIAPILKGQNALTLEDWGGEG